MARLLEREGRPPGYSPDRSTGIVDELLDGVDVLLVAPGLNAGLRRGLQEIGCVPR